MDKRLRIVSVAGARHNFAKMAPLLREMRRHHQIESFLIHTGQHYDDQLS
jgi:UDP-N-acetylglucosamine 2-epimerase (non-hydrolysing)